MTLIIIGITVILSLIAFSNEKLLRRMLFNPYEVHNRNEYHRFITSGFIHSDFIHLAVNMFVLYMFGTSVESIYKYIFNDKGIFYFLLLYVGSLMFSDLPTYAKHKSDPYYNSLGASGAVSAVLFAYIVFQPLRPLYIYGLIPLPGVLLGIGYLVFSAYMAKKRDTRINHDAHFYGAVFGFVFTILLKPALGLEFLEKLLHIF